MNKRAARLGDRSLSSHAHNGSLTGPLKTGGQFVLINNRKAARVDDTGVCAKHHHGWSAKGGAQRILIHDKPAHRVEDPTECYQESSQTAEGSPDVLFGDCTTEKREGVTCAIKLLLRDMPGPYGAPLLNTQWRLHVNGRLAFEGVTDDSGILLLPLPLPIGYYTIEYPGRVLHVVLERTTVSSNVRGAKMRLAAIGYHPGLPSEQPTAEFRSMLSQFQADNDLEVTGESDWGTEIKLLELAGF